MKTLPRLRVVARTLPVFGFLLAACGEPPPATTPPQATDTPTAAPAPAPPPPPPTASAPASAAPSAEPSTPPKVSSGRPAVLKSDPAEISDTFGNSPGAKLELGDKDIATLRIPEFAMPKTANITFKIDARGGKSGGAQVGKIYHLAVNFPPSAALERVESAGDPFVLELPTANKKNVNLAIGVEDDKAKVKWTIVAPKRIDESRNVAVFELTTLASGWMHVTTKPVAAAKK